MPTNHLFDREEVFPSWFANRIQDYLSAARTDFRVSKKSATAVEVIPDSILGVAAIPIQGRWRFRTTTVSRSHPGGASGTYIVWAVAEDNDIDNTPDPFTDHTDYNFDLRITSGADPSGAGVEIFEKVAEIDWSGTEITRLAQLYGAIPGALIGAGALSGSGDIDWERGSGGALIPVLKSNSVNAAKLADNAVDTTALLNLAVTTAKIAVAAITEDRLADAAVNTPKVGNGVITTEKINNLAVTAAKLAAGAVINEKIGNEQITAEKIQNLAITTAKLALEAVSTGQIANLAVTAGKIANLAITTEKLANQAVAEGKIADAAVTSRKAALTTESIQGTGTPELLGGVYQTIPGTEKAITPLVASKLLVWCYYEFEGLIASGTEVFGNFAVDGAAEQPDSAHQTGLVEKSQITICVSYVISLTAAAHTLRLRAKRGSTGSAAVNGANSGYTFLLLAS